MEANITGVQSSRRAVAPSDYDDDDDDDNEFLPKKKLLKRKGKISRGKTVSRM